MSRKWLAILTLFVLILAQVRPLGATEEAAPAPVSTQLDSDQVEPEALIGIQSYGPGDRIAESDEEFVLDSYGSLDRYTFRSGSPIRFPIEITRYFGEVDANGKLLHPENIDGQKGILTLRVWDVDQNYSGPYAPEVDEVYLNGKKVGVLTGANSQWSTFSVEIPVADLKFPDYNSSSGVTPAENWVEVHIDTANVGVCECWAVTVDWGRLTIKGIRPALLVHGFMSNAGTWSTWTNTYAPNAGLPVQAESFANNHGSWLAHASEEAGWIAQVKSDFGVEKINLVGHSKGGLDSRAYLAQGGDDVKRLVMLGTPNAGSPLADIAKIGGILYPAIGLVSLIGEPALTELTTVYMAIGNMFIGPNPNTSYYTVAGDFRVWGISNPLIWGPDDGIVAVSSVEALPYTSSLGHTGNFHTSMTSDSAEWNLARSKVVTTSQAWPVGSRLAFTGGTLGSEITPVLLSSLNGYELSPGGQSHGVDVAAGTPAVLGVLWGSGDLSLTLTSPSGQVISDTSSGVEKIISIDETLGLNYIMYRLEAPEAGTYQLNVTNTGTTPVRYLTVGATEGGPVLTASVREPMVAAGAPATIEAQLDWGSTSPAPVTVEALIERPDGVVDSIPLVEAAPGLYTAEYMPAPGYHNMVVTVSGGVNRIALTGFQALSGSSRFTGVYTHKGVDSNYDGLYDQLSVTAEVTAAAAGQYLVMGQLTDSAGQTLARASSTLALPAGATSVALPFDGSTLGASRFTGDLILTDLVLLSIDGQIHDFVAPAATLSGYDFSQFQRPAIQVLPGTSDTAADLNGDGKYDVLRVQIPVEVLSSGYYDINARLMDEQSQELEWQGITVYLSAGQSTVTLNFTGETIGRHGVDGPYYVRDFSFYARSGTRYTVNIYDFYTTSAYLASQFAGYTAPRPTYESLLAKIDQYYAEGKITNSGVAQSLRTKVENAQAAWERSNHKASENLLAAFVRELAAQEGQHVDAAAAQDLTADAEMLMQELQP